MFTYSIRRDDVSEWLTLGSDQVNSSSTVISKPLCTTDRTSATPTASFTIGCRDTDKYRTTVDYILDAWKSLTKVHARIEKDGVITASGYIDSSSLNIQSSAIPENLTLSIRDYIVDLDRKIESVNFVADKDDAEWSGGITILEAVTKLLRYSGYEGEVVSDIASTRRIAHFAITEEDDCTYREKIDKLLFEAPGLVLWRDPATGKYHVKNLRQTTTSESRVINYLVDKKLKTQHRICDEDGVKVIYPTVKTENRTVYTADIDTGYNDEGIYQGVVLAPGDYWPENGDIQTTYLEYEKDLLDRPYQEKKSRLQNSDLDLLYVRDADMTFRASADLELPVINSIGLLKNPSFFPRKAMVLLHNGSDKNISLERLTITGKATYISKLNRMTLPFDAEDPREYESDYIFDEATAKDFATFYFNYMTIGASVASWVEWEGASRLSELGECVMVLHRGTEKAQGYLICQIDDSSLSGGVRCRKVTAIAVTKYDEYTVRNESSLSGSTGKKILTESQQYYLSDSPIQLIGGEWSDVLEVNTEKYIWYRRYTVYTDGSVAYSEAMPSGTPGKTEIIEYAKSGDAYNPPSEEYRMLISGSPLTFLGRDVVWKNPSWSSSVPEVNRGEYLWRRSRMDTASAWSYVRLTGIEGDEGKGIAGYEYYYLATANETEPAADSVTGTEIPALTPELKYGWRKEIITFTDNTKKTTVSLFAVYGNTGANGNGITGVSVYYALSVSQNIKPTESDWQESMPEVTQLQRYLWKRTVTHYTEDTDSTVDEIVAIYGVNAKHFALRVNGDTLVKDYRNPDNTQVVTVVLEKSGYEGCDYVRISSGTMEYSSDGYIITVKKNIEYLHVRAYSMVRASGVFSSDKVYYILMPDGTFAVITATAETYLNYYESEAFTELFINAVDETIGSIYLGVYDTVSDIPAEYDGVTVVDGDYALVRKPNGFTFSITTYIMSGGSWIITSDPEIMANTVSDAISEAKKQSEADPSVNYISLFYSHKAFVENLTAAVINVGKINSGDIESFDYAEDGTGMPMSGYKLEYHGGASGKGMMKAYGMKVRGAEFESCNINKESVVRGTVINEDENGNIIVRTEQSVNEGYSMAAAKYDGTSNPDAFMWSSYYALLESRIKGRTGDNYYTCTGLVNGFSFKGYSNKITQATKPEQTEIALTGSYSATLTTGTNILYSGFEAGYKVTLTNPSSNPSATVNNVSLTVKGSVISQESVGGAGNMIKVTIRYSKTYLYANGKLVMSIGGGESTYTIPAPSLWRYTFITKTVNDVIVNPGQTLEIQHTSSDTYSGGTATVVFYDTKVGVFLTAEDGTEYKMNEVIPSSGYGTTAQTFIDDGVNYSIVMSNTAIWPVDKYYRFAWDTAPANEAVKVTSFIEAAQFTYDGESYTASTMNSISFGKNMGISITVDTGKVYQFNIGDYIRAHVISVVTYGSVLGLYAANLLPVSGDSNIGAGDSDHKWNAVYCNTLYADNTASTSKRDRKQDIAEWTGDALGIINDTDIVSFSYRNDKDRTFHIGFIADDTDESIAGKEHDRMDYMNCIGVLMKAVQQLTVRLRELESKLKE